MLRTAVGGSGGTIGQDAILNLTANSLSIGGALDISIGNAGNAGNAGGTIGGSASVDVQTAADMTQVTPGNGHPKR